MSLNCVKHALAEQSLLTSILLRRQWLKKRENATNTYQEIISFIKKLSTNDSEPIKEKRKHQLKLAWLSLLKAEMTVSKYRLTIVI